MYKILIVFRYTTETWKKIMHKYRSSKLCKAPNYFNTFGHGCSDQKNVTPYLYIPFYELEISKVNGCVMKAV